MLNSLHISNIAVISDAEINPGGKFTALTGETGAGKSIIVDSIALLLGGHVSRDMIRTGEQQAAVTAVFGSVGAREQAKLAELGVEPDEEGMIYFNRQISVSGKKISRINGHQVPAGVMADAAAVLINIHGQQDNRSLLDPATHLSLLDSYAGNQKLLEEYAAAYAKMSATEKRIASLCSDRLERARLTEMLRYQMNEIDEAKLKPGEEAELEAKQRKLTNIEKIMKHSKTVYRALYSNEKGVSGYELIERAETALLQLTDYIPEAAAFAEKLGEIKYELHDIAETVRDAGDTEDGDPTVILDRVQSRLDQIEKLGRKYGASVNEILAYRADLAGRLEQAEYSDELLAQLKESLESERAEALALARRLTESRQEAGVRLSEEIVRELGYLDMEKVRFIVSTEPLKNGGLNQNGENEVVFLIAANPGEPPKPLHQIASGGELSRVMLAIKSVIAGCEGVPTMIFDEIDIGISGKTSKKIGIKLRALADSGQVICVTHSAQIAASAHTHFLISKNEREGRTFTEIHELEGEDRVREIARIMGGVNITPLLLASAEELLGESENI